MDTETLLTELTNCNLLIQEKESQRKKLSAAINNLLLDDFPKLIQLLYRIDVSETLLKETLKNNPSVDAGELIADLILKRQGEKLATQRRYNASTNDSNEERW